MQVPVIDVPKKKFKGKKKARLIKLAMKKKGGGDLKFVNYKSWALIWAASMPSGYNFIFDLQVFIIQTVI